MKIKDKVQAIRELTKKHGQYEKLAKRSGVGYQWLTKFATGSIDNPTLSNIDKLEQYFF